MTSDYRYQRSLHEAAVRMDTALNISTGLNELYRKIIIYWTLATHAVEWLDSFPLLVLMGKMGTGKSQALKVIKWFAFRAQGFSLRGRTLPAIRDGLASCHNGTAVIEEADFAWRDPEEFERMLSDRYQRASAQAAVKVAQDKGWQTVEKFLFGATVLHRRMPFADPALNGRSVIVPFRADHSRTYDVDEKDPWILEGRALLEGITIELPRLAQPHGIAARIFSTYKPLIGIAHLCDDQVFTAEIGSSLSLDTLQLKEEQSEEPDGMVVRALFEHLAVHIPRRDFPYVRVKELADSIFEEFKVRIRPQQVARVARSLGLRTTNSRGVTVVAATAVTLLKACEEVGYEDELISELKKELLGRQPE